MSIRCYFFVFITMNFFSMLDSTSVAQVPAEPAKQTVETPVPQVSPDRPVLVGNVFPHMTVMAPGVGSNSETGIGAMIPWADRLWAVGYVAHIRGKGIGLYEIGSDLSFKKHPDSVTGTFANRLVHWDSNQAIIGPHIINPQGKVRTFAELSKHRLTATARHLTDPKNKVLFLTMEGLVFEADVKPWRANSCSTLLANLRFPKVLSLTLRVLIHRRDV